MPSLDEYRYISGLIGYREIFHRDFTFEDIVSELKNQNLYIVLKILSVISALLFGYRTNENINVVSKQLIIYLFLISKNTVYQSTLDSNKIENILRSGNLMFHDLSILTLQNLCLKYSKREKIIDICPLTIRRKVFELLLKVNNYLFDTQPSSLLIKPPQYDEHFQSLFKQQNFLKINFLSETFPFLYSRYYQIFQDEKIQQYSLDFPQITNISSINHYFNCGFLILLKHIIYTPEEQNDLLIRTNYYKSFLSKELLCDLKNTIQQCYKNPNRNYLKQSIYDIVENENYPLIRILNANAFYCVCPKLLTYKVTEGAYYILSKYYEMYDKNKYNSLPEDWGHAFENYLKDLLSSTFITSSHDDTSSDYRLDFDNYSLLFEFKAAHWKLEMKYNTDIDLFENLLIEKIFNESCGLIQIIKNIEKEKLTQRKIIPILILGEFLPVDRGNYTFYEKILYKQGIKLPDNILPFIIFSTHDIERIECLKAQMSEEDIIRLIIQYAKEFKNKYISFNQYLFQTGNFEIELSPRIKQHLNQFKDQITNV